VRPQTLARPVWPATIRLRLGLALAIALLPVLLLSAVQAGIAFQRQADVERTELTAAAERSGATARARIESAQVLLETLAPGSVGFQCAQRLSEIETRLKGYENLIRFDADGRFACAAGNVPPDPDRSTRPWFEALQKGAPLVIAANPGATYASDPSIVAAVPAEDPQGRFDGALAAVMSLASLRPDTTDRALPSGSDIALADAQGHWISATNLARFPANPQMRFVDGGSQTWGQADRTGQDRLYAVAPLVQQDVFVVISAPAQGLLSWAWLNPISALALPLLAFALSLIAVWIVAERGVVRWIAYLQRIAAIYARGRFSIRPVQAERAPPEIRDLAETLGAMAATIVARDGALMEHIAQKDAMLLEIHHRVKNNLQIISSLLNMQQRALSDPAARAAISDTRQRISALALIYRALYQSPDMRRVDLREFLEELVGQLITGDGGQRLARTDLACDSAVIDPDRLAPIALFAVEAVSNACKHGLSEGGQLSITFKVQGGQGELTITDTGFEGKVAKLGTGVGRTLMTAYARQLRGAPTFTPNPGGGLTAKVTFPIPESVDGKSEPEPERIRALNPAAIR
jgi:two-component sensor histidine kinase